MNSDLGSRLARVFQLINFLFAFVGVQLLAVEQKTELAPPNLAPPNIVILYADDLGYGDVAAYNPNSKIPTPHIDALAADGIRFTDAHSSSALAPPVVIRC